MLFRFADCTLDTSRRELRRGCDLVSVEPLVLDVLEFLLGNRQRVVSKDDLIGEVWGRRFVSDSTVSSRIAAVRQAIGDDGRAQNLIRTYSRRGYRFVGQMRAEEEVGRADACQHSGQGLDQAATVPFAASVASSKPVIAVLPFVTAPETGRLGAMANGIVEDVTTALSKFRWLSVIARSATFAGRGWATDIRTVGQHLGADYLVEGSVRAISDRVRITARLVSASRANAFWSDSFDASRREIEFAADEITGRIVSSIVRRLELTEISSARRRIGRRDALQRYLLGVGEIYRWTRGSLDDGLQLFRQAIEIEPDFAAAYAMAAYCYVQRKSNGWITEREKESAECGQLAYRAVELGCDDPLVLCRAAHAVASVNNDIDSGMAFVDRALKVNPSLPLAWYVSGWLRLFQGKPRVAAEHLERALDLGVIDPMTFKVQTALSYAYFFLGRHDKGAAIASRITRARPSYQTALRSAAANHAFGGRAEEARRMITSSLAYNPKQRVSGLPDLIPFYGRAQMDMWSEALHRAGLPD